MDKNYSKYWIVTIVDSISATSMPINEFVIYRSEHNYGCKQTIIVLDDNIPNNISMPKDIEIIYIGKDYSKIKKIVLDIEFNKQSLYVIYHIHHQKAGFYFYRAVIGLGIRNRIIFTVHSTYADRNFLYKLTSIFSVLLAKKANCVSSSAYDGYSSFVKLIKGKDFTVISNGVDFSRVNKIIKKSIDAPINKNTLICIGRMMPIKNQVFLIELIKEMPTLNLVLVGAEDKNKTIRKMVDLYKLKKRVLFTGLIAREKVFELFNSIDIYVSASKVEGMPISVLEAMSAGLIPILSDIGPHREIKENCNKAIVLPLNVDVWKNQIKKIINMKDCDFQQLSNIIKNEVMYRYDLDNMHKIYFEIYKSMCFK